MNGDSITLVYEELRIMVCADRMGQDISVRICGGDAPHIGSAAMAEPRLSLTGDGSPSATVSVHNYCGHEDDHIAVPIAKALARTFGVKVVVLCGIHFDRITSEQKRAILGLSKQIEEDLIRKLSRPVKG